MSTKYVALIFIDDENDEFTEGEIKEQIRDNMLEYADNAPFTIKGLIVKESPVDMDKLF